MTSPFAPRLGTNYCPTDEEVLGIENLLVEPILQLKHLDDEIAQLQMAMDKLVEERESLGAYVAAHKALISPVRRLPLEILQEIFIACLPTHRNCVMSASEPPVLLGRICGSWRAVSLSTPRIWAKLHVVEPRRSPFDLDQLMSFEKKYVGRLETMKAWLGRAGDCPLSISLEGSLNRAVEISPDASLAHDSRQFLQALIPFASHWQKISFKRIRAAMLLEALSTLTESDVPILQDIAIFEHPGAMDLPESTSGKRWASIGIFRAQKLSTFSLSAGSLSSTELPLRWSQLTVLSLEDLIWDSPIGLPSDTALQILSQCPELQTCRLFVLDDLIAESAGVDSIIECPHLTTFYLSCRGNSAYTLQQMFRRLSLPELRHVELRGYTNPESENATSFATFLSVATRLESLDISTDTFSNASLTTLLRGLPPTMQRLEITHGWHTESIEAPLNDAILALLTPSHDLPSPCCPALRELLLRQCISISDAALLRLIEARMTADSCSTLERVEASFIRQRHDDILPSLQRFIDTGLRIVLVHVPPRPSQSSPWLGLPEDGPDEDGGRSQWHGF
ncbi:hypothetical protein B0H19DRAFT_1009675 [Mycena capillaripes]|nr:hypothetical protein B0H19DRAFT_1009675 [Mycena capillaripes]